ncbi:MAG: LTA synthase family protein [Bacillota bacterium]|nr:LTA synthase family protein [Bacillota bacterium]
MGAIVLLEPNYSGYWFSTAMESPTLFLWNYLPIFFTLAILFFCSGNLPFSLITGSTLWITMGLISHYKIILRSEPFLPGDITLARELMGIIDTVDPKLMITGVAIIVFLIIAIVLSFLLFRRCKIKWYIQISALVVTLIITAVCYQTFYTTSKYYNEFPVNGYAYNQVDVCGSRGFPYMFVYEIHNSYVQKPDSYRKENYQAIDDPQVSTESYDTTVKPHIIMIMSEAYCDISENVHLTIATDPMKNFKAVAEESVMSGHVVTNIFGGGTVVSEYEALTGISQANLRTQTVPYYFIRRGIDGLPHILSSIGYDTEALHPGFSWFYNRQNVYQHMGFDTFKHADNAFTVNRSAAGGYLSDKTAFEQLILDFQSHLETSDAPLFQFLVTIENHGGYAGKYGLTEPLVQCDIPMSREDLMALSNYIVGIYNADEQIGRLTDYLETVNEPVILVYFGDHKPAMNSVFETIGYDITDTAAEDSLIDSLEYYTTPFFIWENQAAESTLSLSTRTVELGLENLDCFSVVYLGTTLMELLGFDDLSPFMQSVNSVRRTLPVWNKAVWMDSSGTMGEKEEAPQSTKDLLSEYKNWSYYKLFDDDINK